MAKDVNTVALVGRLTRDAELAYTNSGFSIVTFSLAVNGSKKVGDQWQDDPSFFDCKILGRMGESLHKYLTKGKQIGVAGHIKQDRWETKEGDKRSKVVVMVDNLSLMGGRDQGAAPAERTVAQARAEEEGQNEIFTDDVPF